MTAVKIHMMHLLIGAQRASKKVPHYNPVLVFSAVHTGGNADIALFGYRTPVNEPGIPYSSGERWAHRTILSGSSGKGIQ